MTTAVRHADPVTTAVIRHGLVAAGDEMMTNVKRAAYSPSIHQIQDVCVGIVDATGRILTCAPGLPMFLADMGEVVRDGLELVGVDAFVPGDVYISNDPFSIGTHINNVATYSPIFIDERLVAFAVVRGHMVDMGGAVPGSRSTLLTEIYQEGLRIRQLRFYAAGEPVAPIHRLIADNTRMPEAVLGDLRAQVAACRTGERRLTAMIRRYGLATFESSVTDILDQGERLARAAVSAIPDGTYRAEAFLDDDGVVIGERVPIRVVVDVHGDQMTIDFSNFAAQRKGSINTGVNGAISIARNAFKCLTTAHEPVNEGHFRPLTVIAPVGTVVSAVPPAACGWWARTTSTTLDAILRALSPALPRDIPAGHFGDIPMCLINGIDRAGRRFVFFEPVPGGHGGRPHEDGVSATVCFHEGDTPDVPVEVQESTMPILIEESALDVDSAGAGRFRGGLGYRRVFRLLSAEAAMQINVDRHYCLPWGLNGGLPGMPNRAFIQRDEGGEWELVLKQDGIQLDAGSRVLLVGGGGGGWGDPLDRDLDAIAEDIVDGYVTADAASRDYAIVVDPVTGAPDRVATERARGDTATAASRSTPNE